MRVTEHEKRSILFVFIMIFSLMINICIWMQEINKIKNKQEGKYKMVTKVDDSKEFMSISFVKIEESGE